jgi:hypothetical protein
MSSIFSSTTSAYGSKQSSTLAEPLKLASNGFVACIPHQQQLQKKGVNQPQATINYSPNLQCIQVCIYLMILLALAIRLYL